jgi:hypothetical protein
VREVMTKWKNMTSITNCDTIKNDKQLNKKLDYEKVYKPNVLDADPIRDWESFERCKNLWNWSLKLIKMNPYIEEDFRVLDNGTKDGQFCDWLQKNGIPSLGLEISEEYVKYATELNRPVELGNVCDENWNYEGWNYVFSHHVLGLTPSYELSLENMWKATVENGYMITLNDVPGNPKKHYSYISDTRIFSDFIVKHRNEIKIIWNGYWNKELPSEYVFFVKKRKII